MQHPVAHQQVELLVDLDGGRTQRETAQRQREQCVEQNDQRLVPGQRAQPASRLPVKSTPVPAPAAPL
jgi:hypothetical protein